MEKRTLKFPANLRASATGTPRIVGRIPYDSAASIGGLYSESLRPGCFTAALRQSENIFLVTSHDESRPLANRDSRTLKFTDSATELKIEADLDLTINYANDVYKAIKRQDMPGFSFCFEVTPSGESWDEGGGRTITEIKKLYEFSPCVFPAYSEATANVRQKRGEYNMPKYNMDNIATILNQIDHLRSSGDNLTGSENIELNKLINKFDRIAPQVDASIPLIRNVGLLGVDAWGNQSAGNVAPPDPPATAEERGRFESKENPAGPFRTLGEQLAAVRMAETPGQRPDQRLYQVRAASGLSEGVLSDGGFLLQSDFSKEILKKAYDAAPLPNLAKKYQLSSNSIKIPGVDETSRADGSRWGGVRGYWLSEAAEKTASKPTFRQIELTLNKSVVLVYCTDELLEDAGALAGYLNEVAPAELGFRLQDSMINGSGAGQPLGIKNSSALVTVAKEGGQAATSLVWENVLKIWSRMWGRSRPNAVWLINQDLEPQLYSMSLTVGTGGAPVFMPAGQASERPYSTLFGRPVIPIEQCETLGTKGDIYLADFSQYLLADKGGVDAQQSIHVRFIYDETTFRFVHRVDGMPAWDNPLTPFKGTNTQSPFVTLAAR